MEEPPLMLLLIFITLKNVGLTKLKKIYRGAQKLFLNGLIINKNTRYLIDIISRAPSFMHFLGHGIAGVDGSAVANAQKIAERFRGLLHPHV